MSTFGSQLFLSTLWVSRIGQLHREQQAPSVVEPFNQPSVAFQ